MTNDFKPFGPVMTKVRDRNMDPSYEVYLALYQAVSRKRGRKERLQAVQPRLLRPGGHRRMPPGQRPRGQRMAGDPRLLRACHPARPDRHPEGDCRGQHPHLLRRAGLHVHPQAGYRGRIPRALQGRPHRPRQRLAGLAATGGHDRRPRTGRSRIASTTSATWTGCLVLNERTTYAGCRENRRISLGDRPLTGKTIVFCENIRTMRSGCVGARQRNREAPAGGGRHTSKCVVRITGDSDEGKRALERLHPPRTALPVHRHHVEAVDDRRGRQDLQAHSCWTTHRVDDRIQADPWGAAPVSTKTPASSGSPSWTSGRLPSCSPIRPSTGSRSSSTSPAAASRPSRPMMKRAAARTTELRFGGP